MKEKSQPDEYEEANEELEGKNGIECVENGNEEGGGEEMP